MGGNLVGTQTKFFNGAPTGTGFRNGTIAFDTATTPWTGYVYYNGWQAFGSAGVPPSDITLTDSHILVGNSSNLAADVAMSGDAAMADTGQITVTKSSGMAFGSAAFVSTATFDAAGAAAAAQAAAEAFAANASNLSSGTVPQARLQVFGAAQSGIVPLSGGGTANFLRADGTWAAPPASASGANPTATMGTAVVNGSAATFMRSDACPALPIATTSIVGGVKGDNSTVSIAGDGTLSAVSATSSTPGIVQIDNISIHISGGKIATGIEHPGYAAGRYYFGFGVNAAGTTAAQSANTIYAIPFYVPFPTVFTKASVFSGTVSGHVEMGIYNVANGAPTSLVQDFGSIALASGSTEITGLTITLAAGTYALCCAFDGTPSIAYGNIDTGEAWRMGGSNNGSIQSGAGWTGAWTYSAGALPGTFPSPVYAANVILPLTFLRL